MKSKLLYNSNINIHNVSKPAFNSIVEDFIKLEGSSRDEIVMKLANDIECINAVITQRGLVHFNKVDKTDTTMAEITWFKE